MHDGKMRNAIGIQLVLSQSVSCVLNFIFIFGFQFYTITQAWTPMWINRSENEKHPTKLREAILAQTLTMPSIIISILGIYSIF